MKDKLQNKCISVCISLAYLITPILMAFLITLVPFQNIEQRNILFLFMILLTAGVSVFVYRKKLFDSKQYFYLFPIILFSTVCLRVFLFLEKTADYNNFLHPWVETMRRVGWPWQLAFPITDYNLLYTYILVGLSHIPFPDLFLIKGVSVIFDCVLAVTILFILKKSLRVNDFLGLLGFGLILITPSIFLNSSAWGQCDSFYASFLFIGLYLCLNNSPRKGCFFLGLALSAKLQAAFVFPVLLFLIFYRQLYIRHLLWIVLAYVISILPAFILGRSLFSIMTIYFNQIGSYESLTMGAPSFWAMFPNTLYSKLLPVALCIAGIVALLFTFGSLLGRPIKNKVDFWDLAFVYALIIPYFLPKMHERYFYMALVFSIIYSFRYYKRSALALGIIIIDLFSYTPFLMGFTFMGLKWLSLIFLFVIIGVVFLFFKTNDTREPDLVPLPFEKNKKVMSKIDQKILKIGFESLICIGVLISILGTVQILMSKVDKRGLDLIPKRTFYPYLMFYADKIMVKHPTWKEELLKYADDKVIRPSVMDIAEIVRFDEKELILRWSKDNTEHFLKDKNGVYHFQGKI